MLPDQPEDGAPARPSTKIGLRSEVRPPGLTTLPVSDQREPTDSQWPTNRLPRSKAVGLPGVSAAKIAGACQTEQGGGFWSARAVPFERDKFLRMPDDIKTGRLMADARSAQRLEVSARLAARSVSPTIERPQSTEHFSELLGQANE